MARVFVRARFSFFSITVLSDLILFKERAGTNNLDVFRQIRTYFKAIPVFAIIIALSKIFRNDFMTHMFQLVSTILEHSILTDINTSYPIATLKLFKLTDAISNSNIPFFVKRENFFVSNSHIEFVEASE